MKLKISNSLLFDIIQQFLSGAFTVLTEENGVKYKIRIHENYRISDLSGLTDVSFYPGEDETTVFYFGGDSNIHASYQDILPVIVKEEIKE